MNPSAALTSKAGQLHYAANGANSLIEGDTNGDGRADSKILLAGSLTLTDGNLIL